MMLPVCMYVCVCACAHMCVGLHLSGSLCVPLCLSNSLSLAVSVHHGSDPAFLWTSAHAVPSAGCAARLCSFLLKLTPSESFKFKAQCHFCRQAFHDPACISPCYTLLCPNVRCDQRHLPKWTTRDGWRDVSMNCTTV